MEAAVILPLLIILLFGTWEVGRLVQVQQTLVNAAREGARLASGGAVTTAGVTTGVTVSMVQQAVRDYMTAAGLPGTAVAGATITLTNTSSNTWTHPTDAQPLDTFQVRVLIPPGDAFKSLKFNLIFQLTGLNQLQSTVNWMSMKDQLLVVNTTLPY